MSCHHGKRLDDDIPDGHAFAETRTFHPNDALLRSRGFKIVSRPRAGPNLWARADKEYAEGEALRACRAAVDAALAKTQAAAKSN